MSEQRTQPTDADVGAFLDAAQPARRVDEGHRIDAIMREVTSEEPVLWGPTMIGYGSFEYVSPANPRTRGIWPKVGFSPRRSAISLYGLKDTQEQRELLPELGPCTEGAGCVYVKRLDQIDEGVLRRLIEMAWQSHDSQKAD